MRLAGLVAVVMALSLTPSPGLALPESARPSVTLSASATSVVLGTPITLNAKLKPKRGGKVAFQQNPGSGWIRIATSTAKKGKARTTWTPAAAGSYTVRAKAGKTASKTVRITVSPTPSTPTPSTPDPSTPPPPPPSDPRPTSATATWPTGALEIDTSYPVSVALSPALDAELSIQQRTGASWTDVAGGSATATDGTAQLTLSQPVAGSGSYRVAVTGTDVVSSAQGLTFSGVGDALYNVPLALPTRPGVMVKAQEVAMTYPKYVVNNPLDTSKDLIIPQIGDPASGPPACMMDSAIARADCRVAGRQFRVTYTDRRWLPNADGSGQVAGATEAATALVMTPPNVAVNAPVVAWAHPTLGQANPCTVSRGLADLATGPGGADLNLIDASFFLSQMLAKGYIVVMPDFLGNAVNGPTSNQKTFLVGPQEARDLFYAVAALRTPAKPPVGWPGVSAGTSFVAVGHGQGGHAAMWAGVEASDLEPETGLTLRGVTAISPASDLNQIVSTQWDSQIGWVLGPQLMQTWAGYLPQFARDNDILSQAGADRLGEFQDLCTTEAMKASEPLFPNGSHKPGTAFLRDPGSNQQAYRNWGALLAAMTPTITQGLPNSFPKTLPLMLVSGTADDVVVSQANAAMQESFCAGGSNLRAYWTPVTTGAANPSDATEPGELQAANHTWVLNFPFANDVVTGAKTQAQLSAGAVLHFADARFTAQTQTPNCGQRQSTHATATPFGTVQSWYVFPTVDWAKLTIDPSKPSFYDTGGSALLPYPQAGNPMPALGTLDTSNLTQTGCGLPFKSKGLFSYETNPACVQWGLWPYGTFSYPDAVAGSTWGTYPLAYPR